MTEAAISGGADAPAEHLAAPIEGVVDLPAELGSQTPVADKPEVVEEKPKPTAREAVQKAFETVKQKEADKAKAEVEAKLPERGENGKFVAKDKPKDDATKEDAAPPAEKAAEKPVEAKEPAEAPKAQEKAPEATQQQPAAQQPSSPIHEPPARFDDAAKAEWQSAPESVKGAVHRTIRELEQGHQKFKADAEAFHEVREFHELAQQSGTTMRQAMTNYVNAERMLAQDPIKGLEHICSQMGYSLRDVAAHVMGQKPEQVEANRDREMVALKQEIQGLKQQLGGFTQNIEQQRVQTVQQQLAQFTKDHPRVSELEEDMAFFLKSGRAKDLQEAYELADRLNPQAPGTPLIPASPPALAQTQTQPKPANPAGQKSVSGAPATGSDPASSKNAPAPSIRDALKRAKARAG